MYINLCFVYSEYYNYTGKVCKDRTEGGQIMSIDAQRIGKRIKKARLSLNITQAVLADSCDICETYLSYIESGTRIPSLEVIDRIASALGTTISALLGDGQIGSSESYYTKIVKILEQYTPEEQGMIYMMLCSFKGGIK